jgi:MoxR-like ATPase
VYFTGLPDRDAERALLAGVDRRELVDALPSLLTAQELLLLQTQVQAVHAGAPLLDYVQDLMAATRSGQWFLQGLSPRAGIAVLRAAKARALLAGRAQLRGPRRCARHPAANHRTPVDPQW